MRKHEPRRRKRRTGKVTAAIDRLTIAVCWFAACTIFARWTCHLLRLNWSWPAFIVVWAILSVAIGMYIRTEMK